MIDYLHRNGDFIASWGNALVTVGTITSFLPWDKVITVLFVTVPVGVWSWFRLIDYLKARYAKKSNGLINDRTKAL
jgi:ATP/ADP translocase